MRRKLLDLIQRDGEGKTEPVSQELDREGSFANPFEAAEGKTSYALDG
jgi:hypothetical protein